MAASEVSELAAMIFEIFNLAVINIVNNGGLGCHPQLNTSRLLLGRKKIMLMLINVFKFEFC